MLNARHERRLLLRNGIAYCSNTAWTGARLRWLATVKMEHTCAVGRWLAATQTP
jgi:hypothetical protein